MSLRERLKQRSKTTATWPLRIDDPTQAQADLATVQTEHQLLAIAYDGGAPELAEVEERLEAARQAVAACYEEVALEALRPADFEALAAKFPSDGSLAADGNPKAWGDDFPQELFLACQRTELDREEWLRVLAEDLTKGEKTNLLNATIQLNLRAPDPGLPKGWTSTTS